ncbi:FAS1-like dehydratase domain-containing protein [Nakamurella lactea]|uniref:FAS1-like dehydratase domain-containing protein n=1 Tax=Nakamurella lactea TaxID=459515 RepID=UPI00041DEFED|nr:MaoC family dehydratase N-terminal domain-containing protein [Nakamurella lactea]
MTHEQEFFERLQAVVGRPGPARVAKDPITEPAIRIWCEAVDDWNPAYQDPQWAQASRWGGIIAPATTLNMWTLPGNRRMHEAGEPLDQINEVLFSGGFTSVAAVNNDQDYLRPLRPGDRLRQTQHIGMVTPEKQTALGVGHFLDLVSDYHTLEGEPVGRVTLRMLRWNPDTSPAVPPTNATPDDLPEALTGPTRPPRRVDVLPSEAVTKGEHLAPWAIPVTQSSIAALATATYDFNDVHLDRDAAIRRGAKDVYMNILGSSGLVNCFVTDWAGPEAEVRSLRLRLRKQNHPGDTLLLSGEVTEVDDATVTVQVVGRNSLGDHLIADVQLQLPW